MTYSSPANTMNSGQPYPTYSAVPSSGTHRANEESGLDQLSRMLRENQPPASNAIINGNMQNAAPRPGLSIDPHEIQEFRSQIMQAARLDEAQDRSSVPQSRLPEAPAMISQLRASPIQDVPFEHEQSRGATGGPLPQSLDGSGRPAMTILQPTQGMPPVQQMSPAQQMYLTQQMQQAQAQIQRLSAEQQMRQAQRSMQQEQRPEQMQQAQASIQQMPLTSQDQRSEQQMSPMQQQSQYSSEPTSFSGTRGFPGSGSQTRPIAPPETPISAGSDSQIRPLSPLQESSPQPAMSHRQNSGQLNGDDDLTLPEVSPAGLQSILARRPEVRTSDDMLLDIVKSLPPMTPAPQPPQPQVLNGRATRSLGSVLLEGHLVPQERLQVAQHVQRMLRGVDLNYQLGEILLMFKLLTPDQLLAASLVSYGMISTIQITGLGRIRQELHAMGLEYDLESLLVLFRILTPDQLREVRASWSS
jgi:type II secretory pathway pseudopilin PulG